MLAAVCLLLLSGCKVSGHPLPEGMEEDAVLEQGREIVTLLNQGDFQEVYDRLRSDAREGASLETFQAAVNQAKAAVDAAKVNVDNAKTH